MATENVLGTVQSVLNSMDSDDVNSISDTAESEQVALVAKEVYFEMMNFGDWPHLKKVRELESVGDVTQPMLLKIPALVSKVDEIRYDITTSSDTDDKIQKVRYLDPTDFMDLVLSRSTSSSNITKYTMTDGVQLFIQTDKGPEYWTSFDDEYIVFDSYDSDEDTTLQGSKSIINVVEEPTWTHTDAGVIDMPAKFYPTYLARVKAKCHSYFKDTINQLDLQESTRGTNTQRQQGKRAEERQRRPNYGRPV